MKREARTGNVPRGLSTSRLRFGTAGPASALFVLTLVASAAGTQAASDDWWGGAGIGLSFGSDVSYVSVEPIIGYWVNDRLTVGARGILRFIDDDRYQNSYSETDYGLAGFARFYPTRRFFVQGEYEWISYERPVSPVSTDRDSYDSFWAGGGYAQPITRNSWFSVVALYNLTWDDDERSPYSDPWVIRAGVGFRF